MRASNVYVRYEQTERVAIMAVKAKSIEEHKDAQGFHFDPAALSTLHLVDGDEVVDFDSFTKLLGEKVREVKALDLNIGRGVNMGNLDDTQVHNVRSLCATRAERGTKENYENSERKKSDMLFLNQLDILRDQVSQIVSELVGRYGEDFDVTLAQDLVENGIVDADYFDDIKDIEDPDARREAYARKINELIDQGKLSIDDLHKLGWDDDLIQDWLKRSDEVDELYQSKAAGYVKDGHVPDDALEEVKIRAEVMIILNDLNYDNIVEDSNAHRQDVDPCKGKVLAMNDDGGW